MNKLKKCRCCGRNCPLDDFYPSSANLDGRISYCRECSRKKANARAKNRYFAPKMKGRKICRICKEELPIFEFGIAHHLVDGHNSECKVCANKRAKVKRSKNKDSIRRAIGKWKSKNKKRILLYQRKWASDNREHLRDWVKRHYASDENYRISCVLRARIHSALKGRAKWARTMELLGCSIESLKKYLGSKFRGGMSWDNYGEWHIDHIRPCVAFDLSKLEEQRKCFHYTNLQPLWAQENLMKSAKVA